MIRNGYTQEYATRVFKQLLGFGSYGFPESHAVSFALLVYVSSWIKCYYPEVFACALLNSMPMGFYQPAQIVIDAQKHGVKVEPVDINDSEWDNKLEDRSGGYFTLRLGFRQIKGVREQDMKVLTKARTTRYSSIYEIRETGLSDAVLEKLADADAFRSIGQDRRKALWQVSTKDQALGLFPAKQYKDAEDENISLPEMELSEHVVQDYASTSLSLKAHPVSFVREQLTQLRILSAAGLATAKAGEMVKVAGLILVRQRPGTASGICFITIEDETGTANLVVFAKLFDKYRKEIIQSRLLMVEGQLQREGEVIHVIVRRCYNYSKLLRHLTQTKKDDLPLAMSRSDETTSPVLSKKEKEFVQGNIFGEGRNFK
jgi:error-prone DNA polymerase